MSRPLSERHRREQLRASGRWQRCRFCGADVRPATVLVGSKTTRRAVVLTIDRWPHPDGIVIRRRDGQYQMLKRGTRPHEGTSAFRVHSVRECGAETKALDDTDAQGGLAVPAPQPSGYNRAGLQ